MKMNSRVQGFLVSTVLGVFAAGWSPVLFAAGEGGMILVLLNFATCILQLPGYGFFVVVIEAMTFTTYFDAKRHTDTQLVCLVQQLHA